MSELTSLSADLPASEGVPWACATPRSSCSSPRGVRRSNVRLLSAEAAHAPAACLSPPPPARHSRRARGPASALPPRPTSPLAHPASAAAACGGGAPPRGREVIRLGGAFAHGTCKRVHHATWNSVPVAVLMMDDDAVAQERAAFEALERPHPNLVQFYGCCRLQGHECLVMEVAEYGSLDVLLRRCCSASRTLPAPARTLRPQWWRGRSCARARRCRAEGYMFTTAAKVSMALQMAAGVAELAGHGLLHRDIAARNVLVHRMHPIHVKICDLGMARHARGGGADGGGGDNVLVPLRWLPPECLCATPAWSTASDVWALGAPPPPPRRAAALRRPRSRVDAALCAQAWRFGRYSQTQRSRTAAWRRMWRWACTCAAAATCRDRAPCATTSSPSRASPRRASTSPPTSTRCAVSGRWRGDAGRWPGGRVTGGACACR